MHRNNEEFKFTRIVQVRQIRGNTIEADQLDKLTRHHCNTLVKLRNSKTSVQALCRQISEGLSPISFLIVDNVKVIFLIPTIMRENNRLKLHQQIGIQIVISDEKGDFVRKIQKLFDELFLDSHEVVKVNTL